ncbi:LysR family transcriptional regulator [Variovorax rhizosphaerae]|uniref:LysR family transcriptional regulator n=1 Tax=Variovorax rhizosphaerae TaxID=1836200 RepID=A0ABU8WLI1_9BURK
MNSSSDFDWRLIPAFLAALDRGSLLGAARMLGSSQPTVGRHILELETQLGTLLFERTGRGMQPTAMALRLADAARAMEAGAHALARSLSVAQSVASGTVRVSASQAVAVHLLPPLLAQMRQALPEVQVELVSSNEVSNLLRREADIAVRMVPPQQASLVIKRIGKVTLGAYAHRDYLRQRGVPREAGDLRTHDLIGLDRDDSIVRGFAALGMPLTRDAFFFRSDDINVYWQAVRAGMGIGFVADYIARTDGAVVRVLPTLKIPPLPVWLAVHREIRSSHCIRQVYDFLARSIPAGL